jgi:LmbE family N-acetylglucosaminyl deacetylase
VLLVDLSSPPPGTRIVVVSPHSDDGVLSLGAAIASWARGGARVELLTVLACDPESSAPTKGWDQRAGFTTEGDAARGRRREDEQACSILGAVPVWLPYGSVDFERHGVEADVYAAVAEAVEGADLVLLPGSPLSHPDHVWLARVLTEDPLPCRQLALYAEQPYTRKSRGGPAAPAWLVDRTGAAPPVFQSVPAGIASRLAKWRAIRRYRSQLPLLAMRRSPTRGAHVLALGWEAVAWLDAGPLRSGN